MNVGFEQLKEMSKLWDADTERELIIGDALFKEEFKLFVETQRTEIFKHRVSLIQKQPVMLRQRQQREERRELGGVQARAGRGLVTQGVN